MHRLRCWFGAAVMALGVMIIPRVVSANIILELRPAVQTVNVSDFADVGLYAVSDNGSNQLMSAADVMFTWDPTYISLDGADIIGADPNVLAGFFPAADPYGNINQGMNPPTSGTGFWSVLASFGNPVAATPSGTLISTFLLTALAPTPLTVVSIVPNAGNGGHTKVYDGTIPNLDVTGSLGHSNITILPEPASLSLLLLGTMTVGYRRRINNA
jgi:hypothetical protein